MWQKYTIHKTKYIIVNTDDLEWSFWKKALTNELKTVNLFGKKRMPDETLSHPAFINLGYIEFIESYPTL